MTQTMKIVTALSMLVLANAMIPAAIVEPQVGTNKSRESSGFCESDCDSDADEGTINSGGAGGGKFRLTTIKRRNPSSNV
jgi:hypothetical protein